MMGEVLEWRWQGRVGGRMAALCLIGGWVLAAGLSGNAVAQSLLPPVQVEPPATPRAPVARPAPSSSAAARRARARSRVAARRRAPTRPTAPPASAAPVSVPGPAPESAFGPVKGFVATRSATATKTDTPLVETPQSISVVTQDQIRAQGAQTINQALAYTAGVQTQPFGFDARYDQLIIRGFSANVFGNYRDGLRQGNGSFAFFRNEPYDLERIEVFKGPTSVLYGANAPGGLINLVNKLPSFVPIHEVAVDIGSYDRYQGRFDLSGPATPDGSVLYRLTGLVRDSGTQVPNTWDNRVNISPALTFTDDATTLTVMANFGHNVNSMWPYYLRIPSIGVVKLRVGDPEFDKLEQTQWSFGYRFEHKFAEDLIIRQNFRYGRVDFTGPFVDALSLSGTTLQRYAGEFRERLGTVNLDNQVIKKFETGPVSHTFIAGLDYFGQSFSDRTDLGAGAPPLNLVFPIYSLFPVYNLSTVANNVQSVDQIGLYAQDQVAYGGFRLTFGGRKDFVTTQTNNLLARTTVKDDPEKFTGRVGLLYLFENGLAPYVSYSQSFLPTVGVSAPQRGSTPFRPTTGDQYEAGIKFQPTGWNSYITASAFDIEQLNSLTADPLNPGFSIQTGAIRSQGGEVEAVLSLAEGWNGIASYSYTDARVVKSNGPDLRKVPIGVPLQQYGAFLDYTVPYGTLAGLGGGVGFRHIGETWADPGNTFRNKAIDALDLALHYQWANYRLQVTARNAFDQRVGVCQGTNCTFSLGRVVLGSLSYTW